MTSCTSRLTEQPEIWKRETFSDRRLDLFLHIKRLYTLWILLATKKKSDIQ